MVKISDISKDGAFCCDYHKTTFQMLLSSYPANQPFSPIDIEQTQFRECNSEYIDLSVKTKSLTPVELQHQKRLSKANVAYKINKYLEPIAAVLEYVLTSGGDEILEQIEYIAKSLTVKSCPCFHLQMLKLLKVLLLDSRSDNECASPIEFAGRFLNAKGLEILLYLCQNASFDVKAMCIKLIDVLSSQTQLI